MCSVASSPVSHLHDDRRRIGGLIEAGQPEKFSENRTANGDGANFRRRNTHESKTDPDTKSHGKRNGQESSMSYLGHVPVENRNSMIVGE
jgi:hypothetical protein